MAVVQMDDKKPKWILRFTQDGTNGNNSLFKQVLCVELTLQTAWLASIVVCGMWNEKLQKYTL